MSKRNEAVQEPYGHVLVHVVEDRRLDRQYFTFYDRIGQVKRHKKWLEDSECHRPCDSEAMLVRQAIRIEYPIGYRVGRLLGQHLLTFA
jgi:hypothetical protein